MRLGSETALAAVGLNIAMWMMFIRDGYILGMTTNEQAHRLYVTWDLCAREGRIDDLVALYCEDGTFESPLVPVLLKTESGICAGHEEMRAFFCIGFDRRPNDLVRWYRNGRYHFDGTSLIWEYPGDTPSGPQIELMEVMELRDGRIARHRVYWGWRGVAELLRAQKTKPAS